MLLNASYCRKNTHERKHSEFVPVTRNGRTVYISNPWTICITPEDYIITNDGNTLTVFSPTHQLMTKFGAYVSQRGQFNNIFGIAINSVCTIFITEWGNHRLQVITT